MPIIVNFNREEYLLEADPNWEEISLDTVMLVLNSLKPVEHDYAKDGSYEYTYTKLQKSPRIEFLRIRPDQLKEPEPEPEPEPEGVKVDAIPDLPEPFASTE